MPRDPSGAQGMALLGSAGDVLVRSEATTRAEAGAFGVPGLRFECVESIDSTNSELMRRARAGRHEAVLLQALQQTAGRGRQGRSWVASPAGLYLSLGLPLAPKDWRGLSLAVGVALAQTLAPWCRRPGRLGLKWPNDVWVLAGDGSLPTPGPTGPEAADPAWASAGVRKLCGILVETALLAGTAARTDGSADQGWAADSRYVVVGIGVNIETPAPQALDGRGLAPIGLRDCVADTHGPEALVSEAFVPEALVPEALREQVLRALVPRLWDEIKAFERLGFEHARARYGALDLLRGHILNCTDAQGRLLAGRAVGVDEAGQLLVHTLNAPNAAVVTIHSGDVSVRLSP